MAAGASRLLSRRPALAMPSWPRLRNRLIVAVLLLAALAAGYMLWFRTPRWSRSTTSA